MSRAALLSSSSISPLRDELPVILEEFLEEKYGAAFGLFRDLLRGTAQTSATTNTVAYGEDFGGLNPLASPGMATSFTSAPP